MFAAMKSGNLASYTPPAPQPATIPPASHSSSSQDNSQRVQLKVLGVPENTDGEQLKAFFADIAVAKSVKVLPLQEGRSTTLAFLDFNSNTEVQSIIDQKNNCDFNGSNLRLFSADGGSSRGQSNAGMNNRGGSSNERPQVKVFNIPSGADEGELQSIFSRAGNVTRMNVLACREGKDTTLGFVHYDAMEEVDKAIQLLNNFEFNGQQLRVVSGCARPTNNNDFSTGSGAIKQAKVFNIPAGTDENEIKQLFGKIGSVVGCKILPCRDGKDVTLGFVHFETDDEVNKAAQMFHDYEFNGSRLRVMDINGNPGGSGGNSSYFDGTSSRSAGRGAQLLANTMTNAVHRTRGPQAKVFGVPVGTTEDELKEFFASAGSITNVKILPLREGKDTHLCFIEFISDAECQAAVDLFDGQDFNGSNLKIMVGSNQVNGTGTTGLHNTNNWGNSSMQPTGRIPRDEQPPRGDGGIDLGSNFNMNGGMDNDEMMMMQRAAPVTYIPPPPPETEADIFQEGMAEGINFEKYDHIPVEITGTNPPKPMNNFSEANFNERCNENLNRVHFKKPTPVQKYAIPTVLQKRDLMACAQTGSGKTAAFLLPVITNLLKEGVSSQMSLNGAVFPLALVVVPTRELAVQIFREGMKFAYNTPIKTTVIYGGVSVAHQSDVLRRLGCHICVATPGRLDDFVKRGKISFKELKYLILDEADRMLDMGFGPTINNIISNSEMPPKGSRTTLMFSATFPKEIQQMAANFLNDYLFLTVGRVGGTCADVQQTILQVAGSEKRSTLEKILQESGTDRTLVFVERKKDADFLASFLSQRNYPTTSLNGDRSQQEREMALEDFRLGKAPVLVATAVAARGLDIKDVKHVINYDLPSDPTEYVHRIGRTGRIGNKGKATSFFDLNRDQNLARPIVKYLSEAEQEVPEWFEDFALKATGTGYGTDQSIYRDQRSKFNGYRGGGGRGGGRITSPPPRSNNVTLLNTAADDDDEEW